MEGKWDCLEGHISYRCPSEHGPAGCIFEIGHTAETKADISEALIDASNEKMGERRAAVCGVIEAVFVHHFSLGTMTLDHLQHFNGSSVRITLDGRPAVAILFFLTADRVQITSLCYVGTSARCPMICHNLTAAEIRTITPLSRNELGSEITLSSQAPMHGRRFSERDKSGGGGSRSVDLGQLPRLAGNAGGVVRKSIKAAKRPSQLPAGQER